MHNSINTYAATRDRLLADITAALSADERCLASWLTGSFGRGEADPVSDLDLTVVVDDRAVGSLCARPWQSAAHTTPERLALFGRVGRPAIVHENNFNAPEGGTFTCVIYADPAVAVDWVLQPRATARRPSDSRLLFDKAGLPVDPAAAVESAEDRSARASEQSAFFWMMAAITVKFIIRRDPVRVNEFLEMLRFSLSEVNRSLAGQPYRYPRTARGRLAATAEEQVEAVQRLCTDMLALTPRVVNAGGAVAPDPMPVIQRLLAMVPTMP